LFNFLNPKIEAFGMDISDRSVKIARLKNTRDGLVLASYGRCDIPSGIIDKGVIKKEDGLISIIKKSMKEIGGKKLDTNYAVCSLPEQEAFIRVIQLPNLKKEEIREAVRWELEANIPLKIEEVYFDYFIIDPLVNKNKHTDILIGALPKKIVDDYARVLKSSGLKIKAMEIESIATSRALIKDSVVSRPAMIIDLGYQRTSFTIFAGEVPLLTSSSDISNGYFLDVLVKNLKLSRKEAKEMKFKYGLNSSKEGGVIMDALNLPLDQLVADIKKYIDFYYSHSAHKHGVGDNVREIILCGGGANFSGLSAFLNNAIGVPVRLGNPWINIFNEPKSEVPKIFFDESLGYATALGLALYGVK
jgi:type IV pilus assembly protein PilM